MIYINSKEYGMAWEGSTKNQICLDLPPRKGATLKAGFHSFETKDTCVNALYTGGHKELARLVNDKF